MTEGEVREDEMIGVGDGDGERAVVKVVDGGGEEWDGDGEDEAIMEVVGNNDVEGSSDVDKGCKLF